MVITDRIHIAPVIVGKAIFGEVDHTNLCRGIGGEAFPDIVRDLLCIGVSHLKTARENSAVSDVCRAAVGCIKLQCFAVNSGFHNYG